MRVNPPSVRTRAPGIGLALLAAGVILLAGGCLGVPGRGPASPAAVVAVAVDPVSSPDWAADMARFAAEDAARPPPRDPVREH